MNNKQFISLLRTAARRHSMFEVFTDFLTMSACALSNSFDSRYFTEREAAYMATVKKYATDEAAVFPRLLFAVVEAFESPAGEVEFQDMLGSAFMELELGNEWVGQYFTPYPVCQLMGRMQLGDNESLTAAIQDRGFIRAAEPAIGGGALVIALADAMHAAGINYQKHLHVTGVDVDLRAVHMAYIQLTLLHIPAVIVHGNTITGEEWSRWYTLAHVLGHWDAKLRGRDSESYIGEVVERVPPRAEIVLAPQSAGQLVLF
jgi:hypothetical protein